MSHHVDLIQLARQVDLYRRQRRFDLDPPKLSAIIDRVLRRDPHNKDARRARKLLALQSQHWTWQRLGLARIAQFLWPENLVVEHTVTPETQRLRAFSLLTPASALGVVVAALTCVAILWDAKHAWIAKLWIMSFLLVLAVRLNYAGQIRQRIAARTANRRDLAHLQKFGALFGLLWGSLLLATPHLDSSPDAVLPIVFVGACVMSGALTTYFVIPGASPIYACLVGFPLIYAGAAHSYVVGSLAAFYTLWTVVSAFVHQRLFTDSVDRTQELLHERDRFDTALEAAPTGAGGWIWKIDADLQLRDVDPDFSHALDAEPETLTGRPLVDLFGDARRRTTGGSLAALGVTLALRKAFHGIRLISHDGRRLRHWELSGSPRFDEGGHFIGYQGICGETAPAQPAPSQLDDYADDLTGMPPLWALRPRIEKALLKAQHGRAFCAATLIALDGLDQLPKLARHRATLLVIAEAAARLRALAGANAVAYLGSGRFLLFCDDFLRVDELRDHACGTVMKLSGRYDLDGAGSPIIRALGGVALGPVESASSTVLLEQATSALGEAYREPDAVHVYRRRSARPVASVNELRDGLHRALRTNALFPRYSLVLDIATRQPVVIRVEPVWESAQFGRVDAKMIDQVATDIVTRRWLSDLVVGRFLPEAWPVAGPADLSLDAALLDLADAGLKTKLAAAAAAARATQTGIEVVVDTPTAEGGPSAAALDLAGPAILVALRGAVPLEGDVQLPQPITSVWLSAASADPAGAIAHAKATYPHLRRIVADEVQDLGTLDRLAAIGFTAFAGVPPLTQITADEAIAFTQPDTSRRPNGQSRIAN